MSSRSCHSVRNKKYSSASLAVWLTDLELRETKFSSCSRVRKLKSFSLSLRRSHGIYPGMGDNVANVR
mgnify:CR=1